jgi:hypothetical protein
MNKYFTTVAAGLIVGTTVMLTAAPATAASVDINIGVPRVVTQPVYVQPRTVYIQPNYDQEWAERRARAGEWRNNPSNHGQAVSASAHARNDVRKNKHKKHHSKKKHGH